MRKSGHMRACAGKGPCVGQRLCEGEERSLAGEFYGKERPHDEERT